MLSAPTATYLHVCQTKCTYCKPLAMFQPARPTWSNCTYFMWTIPCFIKPHNDGKFWFMSWWIFTLNFSKEVYAHSNTNVEGSTGYLAQFIECWLLDRKEEIKRGQSCKSAAVAFNERLMEISYFENICRPRFSIPSHHVWNSKILLDIPTKSSRNFQRNWYLQHTENNFEAAALLVYALDVAKKSTKPCLVDFLEVSQMSIQDPPQTQMQSVHTCLPIVMLWNLLIPLLFTLYWV